MARSVAAVIAATAWSTSLVVATPTAVARSSLGPTARVGLSSVVSLGPGPVLDSTISGTGASGPSWSPTVVSIALNASGTAVAAWPGPNGGIDTAQGGVANNKWQQPIAVIGEGQVSGVRAAIDPRGDALVDWELGPRPGIAAAAFRSSAAGAWGAPFGLFEERYADFWPPAIALDKRGDAIALWAKPNGPIGPEEAIEASYRPAATGVWQPPVKLSPSGTFEESPGIAFDSRGDAIVVWTRVGPDAQDATVEVDTLPASARAWQAPVKLTTNSSSAEVPGEPTVAVGPRNEAVVAWRVRNEANQSSVALDAAVASMPRGKWRRTASIVRLNQRERADGVQLGPPGIAVNARSEAIVIWEGSSGRGHPGGLQAVVGWPNGGRWQQWTTIATASAATPAPNSPCSPRNPSLVAFDKRGDGVALWSQQCAAPVAIEWSAASRRWRQPVDLSKLTGNNLDALDAALTPLGNVAAVWIEANSSEAIEGGPPTYQATLRTKIKAGVFGFVR